MKTKKEIMERIDELTCGSEDDDFYLDEGEQSELMALEWVLEVEWKKIKTEG